MLARFIRPHRIRQFHPVVSGLQRALRSVTQTFGRGPRTRRVLLASDGRNYTSEQQFAPLAVHASALRDALGVVFEHRFIDELEAMSDRALAGYEAVCLKMSFQTPATQAVATAERLARRLKATGVTLIYFDGDDDLCVLWPEVLRTADLYVKKHVFADPAEYLKPRIGKSNLTDYVARQHGVSFADNEIASAPPLKAEDLSRLHLGWNIGLDDKIAQLCATMAPVDPGTKDIDIGSRAYVKPEAWIYPLRAPVVERLEQMSSDWRVLAPRDRVSQEQYYLEMQRARICVSPFGYGELCWRDFEAILCGCLLVKPDMSHARTYPDIFVDGETYAAVKWDYSNLADVCRFYLENEPERQRVAKNAREVLLRSMTAAAFVPVFAKVLELAGARRAEAAVSAAA